jgi:peptidoglycan hydrolase-like protein with peptidoglycan-binding domain
MDAVAMTFIREIVHHERLLVQLTPYGEPPVMTTFDLRGLAAAIQPLAERCLPPEWLLSDAQIQGAQKLLNSLGYDTGTPDGKPGPKTRAAIKRFQAKQGNDATGQLSRELLDALQQAANKSR